MSIEMWVIRFAGTVVLASLLLAHSRAGRWLWRTAFVGANLLQSSFTGLCPLAILRRRLGLKSGGGFR